MEVSVGEWEGLTNAEVRDRWPSEHAAWRLDPTEGLIPGGEPVTEAVERVERGAAAIVEAIVRAPSGWGIVVSHDGILRLCVLSLLGLPLTAYWALPMAAAGITILDRVVVDGVPTGPWRLRVHGSTEHLAAVGD